MESDVCSSDLVEDKVEVRPIAQALKIALSPGISLGLCETSVTHHFLGTGKVGFADVSDCGNGHIVHSQHLLKQAGAAPAPPNNAHAESLCLRRFCLCRSAARRLVQTFL